MSKREIVTDPQRQPSTVGDACTSETAIECLAELVHEFGSTLELDQVLRNVADGVKQHVNYDTFAVLLLDDLGQELHFRFADGFPEHVVENWRFGLGQGIVGTAALTQQQLMVDDVSRDPRFISAATDIRSELALPLIVKSRTIGVLDVASREPGHFTETHQQVLTFIAGHLANGIENARLYENVRDQARALSLLHETSRELTSILDREKLLRKVAELVKRLIDYQLFSVMLWDEETQLLEHTFSLRYDERFAQKGGFPLGHGVTGSAAALRQPIRVPNVHLSPHYAECGHGVEVRSELAVPLVFKDRLIGVLDLESTEYNAFSEQHEQMLATLGSYVAVALENARLYEKVIIDERRLESDLETAREIQKGLLTDEVPRIPGLDAAFAYHPAQQLGGDFYDFLPYGDDRLAFAIGDVAGKGTPAALYGSLAIGILRGHVVEHPCGPSEMLGELNLHLQQPRIDNRFVAMVFGVFDAKDKSLTVANGGFPRPLLVRDGTAEEILVEGVPLGLFPRIHYAEQRIVLRTGDVVVLSSDGVIESTNAGDEQFGARRLRALLVEQAGQPAQEIVRQLLEASQRYASGSRDGSDDRTIVVLKVL
jgi:sigma-B regulation protein RsbU (phosphoserine phosphatase)